MELPNIPYRVSHRDVKYPRIEFKTGNLLFILPFGFKPVPLLEKHRSWILKKTGFIKECLKETRNKQIVERTEKQFRDLIYSFVKGASKELGGELNNIYFRTMKTKWASLSSKRNLTINRLMRHLPDHLLSYVIFHEVVHLKEKRHNDKFWKRISKNFNNYQELEKDLFVYWFQVAKRRV
jgi:predicted metal-dependent hydrolase